MDIHPKDAVLPDGKIMIGQRVPPEHHLLPRPGGETVQLPQRAVRPQRVRLQPRLALRPAALDRPDAGGQGDLGEPGRESGFRGGPGRMGCPRTGPGRCARTPQTPPRSTRKPRPAGKRALRIDRRARARSPTAASSISEIVSGEFSPPSRGVIIASSARMKAAEARHQGDSDAPVVRGQRLLLGQFAAARCSVGTEWTDGASSSSRLPGPGEPGYHEQMKRFRVRIDLARAVGHALGRRRGAGRGRDARRMGVLAGPGLRPPLAGGRSAVRRPRPRTITA